MKCTKETNTSPCNQAGRFSSLELTVLTISYIECQLRHSYYALILQFLSFHLSWIKSPFWAIFCSYIKARGQTSTLAQDNRQNDRSVHIHVLNRSQTTLDFIDFIHGYLFHL